MDDTAEADNLAVRNGTYQPRWTARKDGTFITEEQSRASGAFVILAYCSRLQLNITRLEYHVQKMLSEEFQFGQHLHRHVAKVRGTDGRGGDGEGSWLPRTTPTACKHGGGPTAAGERRRPWVVGSGRMDGGEWGWGRVVV